MEQFLKSFTKHGTCYKSNANQNKDANQVWRLYIKRVFNAKNSFHFNALRNTCISIHRHTHSTEHTTKIRCARSRHSGVCATRRHHRRRGDRPPPVIKCMKITHCVRSSRTCTIIVVQQKQIKTKEKKCTKHSQIVASQQAATAAVEHPAADPQDRGRDFALGGSHTNYRNGRFG